MARWPIYDIDQPYQRRLTPTGIGPTATTGFPSQPYSSSGYTPWWQKELQAGWPMQWGVPPKPEYGREPTDWAKQAWYPGLVGQLFGRLQGEEQDWRGYLRGLMNYPVGQLGRQLGAQFARSNVAVPVGTDILARRALSPALSQIQSLLDRPTSAMQMMGQARGMAGQLAPEFGEYQRRYGGTNLNRLMAKYLELIFGEQGGA